MTKKISAKTSYYAVELVIGQWKRMFSDHHLKIFIAEALNYCISHNGMIIYGYLITDKRICLILDIQKSDLAVVLSGFFESVSMLISEPRYNNIRIDERINGLFTIRPLLNDQLVSLLIGKPVVLPYYDKNLARLKDRLSHAHFCSVIDYSGARGPVNLQLLKN